MKLVILIAVLCGVVSGDISEIINQSRKYLPPSREYLPPLLPEYQQPLPETSTYVQDPPKLSEGVVEVLTTISPSSTASGDLLHEGDVYIPVQVIIEKPSDNALRQYLPPLTVSTTAVPQSSVKSVEYEETTTQVSENENEASTTYIPQSEESISGTTTDNPSVINSDSTVSNNDSDDVSNAELKEVALSTTLLPDTITLPSTERLETTTVNEDVDQEISNNENSLATTPKIALDVANTESVTDAIETEAATESTPSTTVAALVSEDIDQEINNENSLKTTPKIALDVANTESITDAIETEATATGTPSTTVAALVSENVDQKINNENSLTTTPKIALDVASTESVTDAIETEATTESTRSPTVAAVVSANEESDINEIEEVLTNANTEIVTVDLVSVNGNTTEHETDDAEGTENLEKTNNVEGTDNFEGTSTSDHVEGTTSNPVSADVSTLYDVQEVPTSESVPVTTSLPSDEIINPKREPNDNELRTTTIVEYIQNGQKLETTTKQILSEPEIDLVRSNNLDLSEVSTTGQSETSTPETLLLEDGYHYSIPSILFGSFNI